VCAHAQRFRSPGMRSGAAEDTSAAWRMQLTTTDGNTLFAICAVVKDDRPAPAARQRWAAKKHVAVKKRPGYTVVRTASRKTLPRGLVITALLDTIDKLIGCLRITSIVPNDTSA